MSERIGVFVDVSNLYYCVSKRFSGKVDYQKYLAALNTSDRFLIRAYAYCAQMGTEASRFIDCLKLFGYVPRCKKPKEFDNPEYRINLEVVDELINLIGKNNIDEGLLSRVTEVMESVKKVLRLKKDTRKADWDVGLAMDVVRSLDRLDTVIIGSADSDLASLADYVRERGRKCIVFACNVSRELRDSADEVIEIEDRMLEGRT